MPCCDCCCPDGEECCKAPGPDGICCDPERCCGTEEDPICCSELDPIQFCCGEVCCNEDQYCCEGVCQEEPCEESECEVDGDCEEGEYCCDGQCEPEPCDFICVLKEGPDCNFYECEPDEGQPGIPCDTALPPYPTTGTIACFGGTPTQVTVTITGVTFDCGDAAANAEVEGLINTSYVVDIECTGFGQAQFEVGDITVTVGVEFDFNPAPGGQTVGLGFVGTSGDFFVQGNMGLDIDGATIATNCGPLLDCSDFGGPLTYQEGSGDLDGAGEISVSGM